MLHLTSLIHRPTHYIILSDDEEISSIPLLETLVQNNEISYIHITHSIEDQGREGQDICVSDGNVVSSTLSPLFQETRIQQLINRKKSLQRLGIHYLQVNEKSNIQKSLLSLWL